MERAAAPSRVSLFTIGYGSRDLAAVVDLLRTYDIGWLVDVRSRPYSKWRPEFSKHDLEPAVRRAGLGYLWLGDALGGMPDDPATLGADGLPDDDRIVASPLFRRGIERLRDAHAAGERLALMCAELRPESCHRARLIAPALEREGLPFLHIDEDGGLRTQREIILRSTGGQLGLFDE